MPNARISQDAIEAVISSVVTPAKVRVSQAAIEVVILYAAPAPVTKRYGPRIQAV